LHADSCGSGRTLAAPQSGMKRPDFFRSQRVELLHPTAVLSSVDFAAIRMHLSATTSLPSQNAASSVRDWDWSSATVVIVVIGVCFAAYLLVEIFRAYHASRHLEQRRRQARETWRKEQEGES
jgi:hypothetical protein